MYVVVFFLLLFHARKADSALDRNPPMGQTNYVGDLIMTWLTSSGRGVSFGCSPAPVKERRVNDPKRLLGADFG